MPRFGHLDIGENVGDAKDYNPMPVIQQYGQILAQRQAKHDQEVQQLGNELAKGYDPNGLRNDADKQLYLKTYNGIKDDAIAIENEKDPTKKAIGLSNIKQRLGDLGALADESKKQGGFERGIAMQHLQNPYLLDDNSAQRLTEGLQKSVRDPSLIKDASGFERKVDPDKVDKMYQAHRDLLTKNMQYDNGTQTPATVAGKRGAYVVQSRGIPMDGDGGAFENTLHWATALPDVQKSLQDRYPQIQGDTPQHTLGLRVKQYMNDSGDKEGIYDQTKPVFHEGIQPDKFYAHWNYEAQHPHKPAAVNLPSDPINNFQLPYNTAGEKGGFPISVKNFVPLTDANKTFAGSADIDMQNGGSIRPTQSAITGTIAGVGDIPVYNNDAGGGTIKKGTPAGDKAVQAGSANYRRMVIIQKKGDNGDMEQYLVDYNKLPANIKNSKPIKEALAKFEQTPVYGTQSAKKSIKSTDVAAKASAAGYSVKEYTDILKKNGVTIE